MISYDRSFFPYGFFAAKMVGVTLFLGIFSRCETIAIARNETVQSATEWGKSSGSGFYVMALKSLISDEPC
jgi:hypothetical protein